MIQMLPNLKVYAGGTIDSVEFGTTLSKLFGWRPTRLMHKALLNTLE